MAYDSIPTPLTKSFPGIGGGPGSATWAFLRPEVLPYIRGAAESFDGGPIVDAEGTAEQLVAASLAQPEWFELPSKSKSRTFRDEYGNRITVQRRARGWRVCICVNADGNRVLRGTRNRRPEELIGEVAGIVDAMIERARAPRI